LRWTSTSGRNWAFCARAGNHAKRMKTVHCQKALWT